MDHLTHEGVDGVEVVRLARPDPSRWAPSPALDAGWVEENAALFDVLHLHFGFEGRTPAQLRELTTALRRRGRGLVLTVHDLQNPHLTTQHDHDRLLDVLVPAADEVVTLTPGAADEVERRWSRRPQVVPHPHVAPFEAMTPRPPRSGPRVVGVHLKSLRANLVAGPVLESAAEAVRRLPGTVLRVDVHGEALEPSFPRHDAALSAWLRDAHADGRVDLRVHDRFDDEELFGYLRELDVSLLAYGHGTHSGWLELCHDLGVPVVAGHVGYLHQQQRLEQVDLLDPQALAAALDRAAAAGPGTAADAGSRAAQRRRVAQAHRDLYLRVVSQVAPHGAAGPRVDA
ncbi:glycosyltransferase family 1 protein [Kineococcus rhizosphaerae]|uniref:glycosyltransferase family 1 protein n=1 Tax=Kineococcus rhizosphaerae TaxID=559628 RepID=UPI0011B27651|nr:glycosyltransferase family 1 protein [Kineococcus rhizosphaerae]